MATPGFSDQQGSLAWKLWSRAYRLPALGLHAATADLPMNLSCQFKTHSGIKFWNLHLKFLNSYLELLYVKCHVKYLEQKKNGVIGDSEEEVTSLKALILKQKQDFQMCNVLKIPNFFLVFLTPSES